MLRLTAHPRTRFFSCFVQATRASIIGTTTADDEKQPTTSKSDSAATIMRPADAEDQHRAGILSLKRVGFVNGRTGTGSGSTANMRPTDDGRKGGSGSASRDDDSVQPPLLRTCTEAPSETAL